MAGCKTTDIHYGTALDKTKKVILKEMGAEEFFYWEMKDEERLWELEIGDAKALALYRDSLRLSLGDRKYQEAIDKESAQNLDRSLIDNEKDGDRINTILTHSGSIGKIRKINHLESQILNYQITRYPMFSQPTEFHGFIAKNDKKGMIRVYFGASNTEWPPRPSVIIEELEKNENKDWRLISHLHNHYCKQDKDYVGILAPSLADAEYFKMLKERFDLPLAHITNGFHTVEIESKDFEKFESH